MAKIKANAKAEVAAVEKIGMPTVVTPNSMVAKEAARGSGDHGNERRCGDRSLHLPKLRLAR